MPELTEIYQHLLDRYGCRHWWPADTPFEVAVGAILTQNTNWNNVETAIINLRGAEALTCGAINRLPRGELESLIRPSGFFRQKAERLQLFSGYLREHYQDSLELMLRQPLAEVRQELLAQKGIGPETADSILLYAGGHPSFVIDAYTLRLFSRIGLFKNNVKYEPARDYFMQRLPVKPPLYNEYHALIVIQCKQHCRKRPLCSGCPLEKRCRYRQLNP
jgi:endonuclease-3 related protein